MSTTVTNENTSGATAPQKKSFKKTILIVLIALLAFALGVGGTYFLVSKNNDKPKNPIPVVKTLPPVSDTTITLPDNGNQATNTGNSNLKVSKYDPNIQSSDLATAKPIPVDNSGNTVNIPIMGACPIKENGHIDAPKDWTVGCYYKAPTGGLAYLGHSIRGPITGAFELIGQLQPGQTITVGGHKYKVERVSIFPNTGLPNYLWQPGHLSLITCTDSSDVEAGADWKYNTVVSLVDAQ